VRHRCAGLPLQHLDLRACVLLTDATLAALAQHCGGLKRLLLDGCGQLTTAGVLEVRPWPLAARLARRTRLRSHAKLP
jgi:hypothetical protein